MLLRFGVENFRSIKEYQEVSLVASSLKDRGVELIDAKPFNFKALPAIGIYGANASGKSTLLRALRFMRSAVAESAYAEPGAIARQPFALDKISAKKPTRWDCDFIVNERRFHYGFLCNEKLVLEEWLYCFDIPNKRVSKSLWFYRDAKAKVPFQFGKDLRGRNKLIADLTRPDALFLSSAAKNNHKQLEAIFQFFVSGLVFRDPESLPNETPIARYMEDAITRKHAQEFLALADTGIVDIEVRPRKSTKDVKEFSRALQQLIKQHIKIELPSEITEDKWELLLKHKSEDPLGVAFGLDKESTGTRALLSMLGPVFDCLVRGKVIIVDELNANLHPIVSKHLISMFASSQHNIGGGQMIFATHDTNLLCDGALRRDQIWFTEKDKRGATHIYPLSDINTRQTDNLERGYLQGRFGAVPYLGGLPPFESGIRKKKNVRA